MNIRDNKVYKIASNALGNHLKLTVPAICSVLVMEEKSQELWEPAPLSWTFAAVP
jgi:hypothetical protein